MATDTPDPYLWTTKFKCPKPQLDDDPVTGAQPNLSPQQTAVTIREDYFQADINANKSTLQKNTDSYKNYIEKYIPAALKVLRDKLDCLSRLVGVREVREAVEWHYLDTTLPDDVESSIIALYQFDETASYLLDRSGAGRHLVLGGVAPTITALNGLVGRVFYDDTTGHLLATAVDASLAAAAGAITVEMLLSQQAATTDEPESLISISGDPASETEANNFLFDVRVLNESRYSNRLQFFWEYSGGLNESVSTPVSHPVGGIHHMAITRSTDGLTCKSYIDSKLLATSVATHVATGGTSARIKVGGFTNITTPDTIIFAVRITFEEFTAAQVLQSYLSCKGLL